MEYRSGINLDHIKAEFLADLERQYAHAELEVYGATSDEEIRERVAARDDLAARINNVERGPARQDEIDAALAPPPTPSRNPLKRKK